MPRSSESVVVSKSPAEVFAFVADLRNEPLWHVDVTSVPPDTEPVPVVGKSTAVTFTPFMGRTDGIFTAEEVIPGSRIVYRGEMAGIRPKITYLVEPVDGGARFTRSVDLHLTGALWLMTPVMALMVPRRNKVFVQNLKRVLESR
jgi:hypothetical protein